MKEITQFLTQLSDINDINDNNGVEQKKINKLNDEIENFIKLIDEKINGSKQKISNNNGEIDKKGVSINFLDIFKSNELDINQFIGNKFTFDFGDGFNEISENENKYEQILKFIFIINNQINCLERNINFSIKMNNERFEDLNKKDGILNRMTSEFNKYNNPYNYISIKSINSITFDLGGLRLDNGKFKGEIEIYINDIKDNILMFRISNNILTELHDIGGSSNLAFFKDNDLLY